MKSDIFAHHAYFAVGNRNSATAVMELLEESGFKTTGNPDFWQSHFDKFGIPESRMLKDLASRNAYGERKVFIISLDAITVEAQNALLKTLEDPTGNSVFYFILPKVDMLLPTLSSRLMKLSLSEQDIKDKEPLLFLKKDLEERILYVQNFVEEIKKEKKTKRDAEVFLNNLEKAVYLERDKFMTEDIKKFLEIKSYIGNRGSSVKIIMESVAVILPSI
jgi:DNA polymerase III gamma/tau subunit